MNMLKNISCLVWTSKVPWNENKSLFALHRLHFLLKEHPETEHLETEQTQCYSLFEYILIMILFDKYLYIYCFVKNRL